MIEELRVTSNELTEKLPYSNSKYISERNKRIISELEDKKLNIQTRMEKLIENYENRSN